MTRRTKRTPVDPYELSEEAEAMLSKHTELTRIDPVFRRAKHQDEVVLDELRDAGIFRSHWLNLDGPLILSEVGVERARSIRSARLALEPQDLE